MRGRGNEAVTAWGSGIIQSPITLPQVAVNLLAVSVAWTDTACSHSLGNHTYPQLAPYFRPRRHIAATETYLACGQLQALDVVSLIRVLNFHAIPLERPDLSLL